MKLCFVLKGNAALLPPIIPRIIYFANRGCDVTFISGAKEEKSHRLFENNNIRCIYSEHNAYLGRKKSKIKDWYGFRKFVRKQLNCSKANYDYLYICSADTAICLKGLFENKKFCFQINELYDTNKLYRNLIKNTARCANIVIVPEYIRANIFMYWYSLKKMPIIIPNMPYTYSKDRNLAIKDETARGIIGKLSGKRIILYQGHINNAVRNLVPLAKALKQINSSELAFVLMGNNNNGSVEQIKNEYEYTYHIPFISAPEHLEITSHADIGIVNYNRTSLNNMFCAPNKVFEYSCYGIPILGNDIPGLKFCIESIGFGECADFNCIDSIALSITKIINNYSKYAEKAKQFFEQNEYYDNMSKLFTQIKLDSVEDKQ